MLIVFVALLVGTFSGTLAGGALAWWLLRHGRADAMPVDALPVDPEMDERIKGAASRWAEAHGRPDAAHLIADKLRLVYNLNRRRQRRPERRW